jgi:hypothetical protein
VSGRGLCDELAPRPGKSHRLWCVVCNFETSTSWNLSRACFTSENSKRGLISGQESGVGGRSVPRRS